MCDRHSRLHPNHFRVQRAQAHGMRKALDRAIRLTSAPPLEGAQKQCRCEIRIKYQRPVEQCDAAVEFAAKMTQGMTAPCQCDRVVLAQFHRAVRQARTLRGLLSAITHPAVELAPEIAPGCHSIS